MGNLLKILGPKRVFLFFTLLRSLLVFGQNRAEEGLPFITNYTAKEYNSSPQNWAIVEDNRGVMYFGNTSCLLEYNGVKWRKIVFNTDAIVRSLGKDKNGTIYYGGYSDFGYLAPDSLGQPKMHSLLKFVPVAYRNFNDVWTVIATDEGVYFQSRERIFRFQKINEGGKESWKLRIWNSPQRFMYAFYFDNTYYVHQQGVGILKLVNDKLVFVQGSSFLGKERVQVMLPYTNKDQALKQYLFGAFNSGLYLYNGSSFTHFSTDADSLLFNNTLYKGITLRDGSYALSTAGRGIVILDKQGKKLQQLNREVGLQDESVYAVYTDKKGTLWMALDNGISRVEAASPFTQFTIQSGISTATINVNRFEGDLYIGTTNGLLKLNPNTAKFGQVKDIPANQVFALIPDSNKMLVSTDGLFSLENNKIHTIKESVAGDFLVSGLYISKKNRNILFAGLSGGMAVLKRNTSVSPSGKSAAWVYEGLVPGVTEDVWTFAESRDGSIWAGTQQGSIRLTNFTDNNGHLSLANIQVKKFGTADGLSEGSIYVSSIQGTVFFVSGKSVFRFNTDSQRFMVDTSFGKMGFGNDPNQYVVKTDYKERVWLNFGKETALATPKPGGGYLIEKTPFLPIADHVVANIFPEPNGIVWFATTDGLIRYNENLKKDYSEPFTTLLQNIIAEKQALALTLSSSQKKTLPYNQNSLRFDYAAPFFEQEKKTQYQTWLEGFEPGWSNWDNNTYKEYTNLPGGKYHFHVRAKNVYQNISQEAQYSFTIKFPWYQTWWAYLLYILVALSAIYLFTRYRTSKLRKQQIELERKVQERTREVQQQAEELTTVNQISQALASQINLDDLIKLVGEQMRQLFKANIVYLALLDKKSNTISFPYQYGEALQPMKLGEGITSKVLMSGQPILINKDVHEVAEQMGIRRVGIPAASYIGVPIPIGDEAIGVLSVQSTVQENRFSDKDVHLLSTIAAHVGTALRKAKLFEEVKQARQEADTARKAAEAANEAKSAFLSTVSHELRTPLTSVLGFAKIIKKRLEEKILPLVDSSDPKIDKTVHQVSDNLNVVITEGERLTNLINDVLDLAKIEAGKMEWNLEPIEISSVAERSIAATTSLFEQKKLVLEKQIQTDLPEIMGDRDKLIQVMVNLISNAVKFTPEGSVTCRVYRKDDEIVVDISDTGIGIASQDHAAVFEQFKQVGGDTLTDKPKGTGLGLPICKEIIEHHGGRIWLESEPGKGSTFSFALPIIKSDVKLLHFNDLVRRLNEQMKQSTLNRKGSKATILVVDDDESIRSLLRQELSDAGYIIEEATNGKEALSKVRANRPDLVILDIMMPEMNGFDVAAILKNDPFTMDIPILVLSIIQDKARGYRIGVDQYLTKPIDTTKLFDEVGHLLEQGKSKKKVMVVDEDKNAIHTLTDVLAAKGYHVVESDGKELIQKAIDAKPDIIILNALVSRKQEIVQSLRFEKGLENVLFIIYQPPK